MIVKGRLSLSGLKDHFIGGAISVPQPTPRLA
jgi:hypothetical protein